MEILGVGVPELAFIVLIALILLGPKDMIAAGRTIGRTLRKFMTSPAWQAMRRTGDEIQQLPTKLMRDAGLEELQEMQKEVLDVTQQIKPPDLRKAFDERQIFAASPSSSEPSIDKPDILSEPPPPNDPKA